MGEVSEAEATPGPGRALDAPGVRAALGAYRRNALLILVGGIVVLIGFVVAADHVETRADELEQTGVSVAGRVQHVDGGGRYSSGAIEVGFTYQGVDRVEVVHLDDESPRYAVGQTVTVYVDPDDPEHASVAGETNQSPATVLPMIVALIVGSMGMVVGAWSLARVHRQRRRLRADPWRRATVRYREIPAGRGSVRSVLLLDDGTSRRLLTVVSMVRWRLRRTGLRDGVTEVELVGDLGRYVVIRADPKAIVVSARPPMSARTARRWTTEAFPDLDPGSEGSLER